MLILEDLSVFSVLARHVHPNDKDPKVRMFKVLRAINYYGYYWQIGAHVRPKSILEIGVRYGYSAICLIDGAQTNPSYVGIDHEHFPNSNAYALEQIRQHTTGSVSIIKATSQRFALNESPPIGTFDLVHLDASHKAEGVLSDLNFAGRHLKAGGMIIIDDVKVLEVYAAALTWAGNRHYDVQSVASMTGTLLIWKRSMAKCEGRWS